MTSSTAKRIRSDSETLPFTDFFGAIHRDDVAAYEKSKKIPKVLEEKIRECFKNCVFQAMRENQKIFQYCLKKKEEFDPRDELRTFCLSQLGLESLAALRVVYHELDDDFTAKTRSVVLGFFGTIFTYQENEQQRHIDEAQNKLRFFEEKKTRIQSLLNKNCLPFSMELSLNSLSPTYERNSANTATPPYSPEPFRMVIHTVESSSVEVSTAGRASPGTKSLGNSLVNRGNSDKG